MSHEGRSKDQEQEPSPFYIMTRTPTARAGFGALTFVFAAGHVAYHGDYCKPNQPCKSDAHIENFTSIGTSTAAFLPTIKTL